MATPSELAWTTLTPSIVRKHDPPEAFFPGAVWTNRVNALVLAAEEQTGQMKPHEQATPLPAVHAQNGKYDSFEAKVYPTKRGPLGILRLTTTQLHRCVAGQTQQDTEPG
jgi:hypothetical protein